MTRSAVYLQTHLFNSRREREKHSIRVKIWNETNWIYSKKKGIFIIVCHLGYTFWIDVYKYENACKTFSHLSKFLFVHNNFISSVDFQFVHIHENTLNNKRICISDMICISHNLFKSTWHDLYIKIYTAFSIFPRRCIVTTTKRKMLNEIGHTSKRNWDFLRYNSSQFFL